MENLLSIQNKHQKWWNKLWMVKKKYAPQILVKCAALGEIFFFNLARKQKSLATPAL